MLAKRIEGATQVAGRSQGFIGLPIRQEMAELTFEGEAAPRQVSQLVTHWEATPRELEAMATGAAVEIKILANLHPPILVGVTPPAPAPAERDSSAYAALVLEEIAKLPPGRGDEARAMALSALDALGQRLGNLLPGWIAEGRQGVFFDTLAATEAECNAKAARTGLLGQLKAKRVRIEVID